MQSARFNYLGQMWANQVLKNDFFAKTVVSSMLFSGLNKERKNDEMKCVFKQGLDSV